MRACANAQTQQRLRRVYAHILDVVDFSDQCLHSLQQRDFKVYIFAHM